MKHSLYPALAASCVLTTLYLAGAHAGAQPDGPTPDRGANGEQSRPRTGPNPNHEPLEQGRKNVPELEPAFLQQTRAEGVESKLKLEITQLASGLESPWALAFLPDRRILITEKYMGRLLLLGAEGQRVAELAGVPRVDGREQGGLLDVAIAPDFAETQHVYLSYYEPRQGGSGLTVIP